MPCSSARAYQPPLCAPNLPWTLSPHLVSNLARPLRFSHHPAEIRRDTHYYADTPLSQNHMLMKGGQFGNYVSALRPSPEPPAALPQHGDFGSKSFGTPARMGLTKKTLDVEGGGGSALTKEDVSRMRGPCRSGAQPPGWQMTLHHLVLTRSGSSPGQASSRAHRRRSSRISPAKTARLIFTAKSALKRGPAC